jgi:biopolymer transport protein ExbD
MALSLQSQDSDDDGWLAEINTTPLVDVMLVLLIIFLLTVPVVSASVQLKLPVQSMQQQDTSGDYLIISIDAAGNLFLNESPAASVQQLAAVIEPVATQTPKPHIHIRADAAAPYSSVAPIVDMAQSLGFAQVSLLTEQSPQDAQALAQSLAASRRSAQP